MKIQATRMSCQFHSIDLSIHVTSKNGPTHHHDYTDIPISLSNIRCFLYCFILSSLLIVSELEGDTEVRESLQRLRNKIDTILNTSILKNASVGIQIVSLNSGDVIYEHNPDLLLNPASNTKLVTSAVVLAKLKSEYRFKTYVYTDVSITAGTLKGNLYLKGGGDPSLDYEGLLSLAQDVYNAGIRNITGNIVGDDSFFDAEREFAGWHDFSNTYSGKISALSLNKSMVNLVIKPSQSPNTPPVIIVEPPSSYIQLQNTAVTLSSTRNRVYAYFLKQDDSDTEEVLQEVLLVKGKISKKTRYGLFANVSVHNPSLFTTTAFKDALAQVGITTEGKATLGKIPAKPRRIATHYSEPLSRIIFDANKASDNFVAEQLLKTLGAEIIGVPGTTEKGLSVVREFLTELDILPDSYVLENGSGLSRNNRLSPEQIVALLTYMYENFALRSEYLASLSIAGVDGTLQRRLQNTSAERRLRAKTGAIRSVSCLSGYAASQDNEIFAFSMMMNDYKSGGYDVQKIQNTIGILLTEFYRPTYNVQTDVTQTGN